jgi:hypothetical protein
MIVRLGSILPDYSPLSNSNLLNRGYAIAGLLVGVCPAHIGYAPTCYWGRRFTHKQKAVFEAWVLDANSIRIPYQDYFFADIVNGTRIFVGAMRSHARTIKVNDMIGFAMSYAMKKCRRDSLPASAGKEVSCELAGMRVQLMKALSYVHYGALLVYRLRTDHIESEAQLMLGGYFVQNRSWLSDEVEPLFVPGTLCPEVIGYLLMRFGWVKPVNSYGSGYTRNFVLSEAGEKAFQDAKVWWHSLNWFQKAWLYVME